MPIDYLRTFTTPRRTDASNRRLGRSLAFVAGAANAGGFLAVGQYTSHMSGVVSALADNAALGDLGLVIAGLSSLLAFLVGAATSAILINWGRRRNTHSEYAMPLMLEAILLLCFGLIGTNLEQHRLWYRRDDYRRQAAFGLEVYFGAESMRPRSPQAGYNEDTLTILGGEHSSISYLQ